MRITRREALKRIILSAAAMGIERDVISHPMKFSAEADVVVFRALNGPPGENLRKVLELSGGIEKRVGIDDIVVIKPNTQWWNQGAPNLAVMNALVECIMNRNGGFKGEVLIAENCHRGLRPWESNLSGWRRPFIRNADLPGVRCYNDLVEILKKKYDLQFSVCHWINVDAGAKRVHSALEGPGYVFCDGTGGVPRIAFGNGAGGDGYRETIMTYPIFQTDRGTVIDFKNGVYERGDYSGRPLRFFNMAALNHHSSYCGMTSLIKNYLGVSDLSGGPDPYHGGRLDGVHYNFHSFPFDKWAPGPAPGMLGAEIGEFLSSIRRADLNIVSAEWVGLASRTDLPAVRPRAVLACVDPVALDYHSAKYILHPNSRIRFHDPDDPESPTCQYLQACARHGGGTFDERKVAIRSYDIGTGRFHGEDEIAVRAEKQWGHDPKTLAKYFLMRYGSFLI